jgi:hypothetical protein
MLLRLPLAFLPYLLALPVFLGATSATFVAGARRLLPPAWPMLAAVASPAVLVNAASAQNGCLSAALFTGAMITLESRPAVACTLRGVFAFKPHLALCVPAALLCARRWRDLFGMRPQRNCPLCAFLRHARSLRLAWFFRLAAIHPGDDANKADLGHRAERLRRRSDPAQAVAAAFALVCVIRTSLARPGGRCEMAVVIAGALLCTPYVMDYDLVSLGAPMAWLAATAVRSGWRPWEKLLLALLYMYPLAARTLALMHIPLAPLLIAALLSLLLRRVAGAHYKNLKEDAPDRSKIGGTVLVPPNPPGISLHRADGSGTWPESAGQAPWIKLNRFPAPCR